MNRDDKNLSASIELRFVSKFPRGCLTTAEAIQAILSESKDHGFLDADIFVRQDSPQWQKDEVLLRAKALYISSHHSNVPWVTDYTDDTVGILLVENGGIIGAAGFEEQKEYLTLKGKEYVDVINTNWRWTFAFIDPQHQRKGYVSKRIPEWQRVFGEFTSTRAWSEAVRAMFEKLKWFPAGEVSLERNEAELNKLQLADWQRAGRISRRWIKEGDKWVQLSKKNADL